MRHINNESSNNNNASTHHHHHPNECQPNKNELMPNEEWFIIPYVEWVSAYIIKLRFTSLAEDYCVCTFCAAAKIECLSDQYQTCMVCICTSSIHSSYKIKLAFFSVLGCQFVDNINLVLLMKLINYSVENIKLRAHTTATSI